MELSIVKVVIVNQIVVIPTMALGSDGSVALLWLKWGLKFKLTRIEA